MSLIETENNQLLHGSYNTEFIKLRNT